MSARATCDGCGRTYTVAANLYGKSVKCKCTATVTIPAEDVKVAGAISGDALYVGAFAGAAFGYRSVFVGPELTLVQLIGNARVTALDRTVQTDLDSLVIYPAFAVMGEF